MVQLIPKETLIADNEAFAGGVQYVWDATSISLAQTCLYKYELKMLWGWQPEHKSVHLVFGGHYATALEHFYKYRFEGATIDEALRKIVRETLVATWDTETNQPWVTDSPNKTRETLVRTIVWYVEQFAEQDLKVVALADGTPAVEHTFKLPVDNDLILAGHLDRLVEMTDGKYVMDQKTTKATVTAQYFKQFTPNTQMSMYTFAGQMIYNTPVKGIIIDAAQIAVGFSSFTRGFAHRSQPELNEWYDDTMWWIEQARKATVENYFPRNPASCDKYGGCEFRDICSRAPGARPNFLADKYVQGPSWDPMQTR